MHLVALESVLSYPVPAWRGDSRYLRFLVYRCLGADPRHSLTYPPHARVSIEYPSGRLVEYTDLGFSVGKGSGLDQDPLGETPSTGLGFVRFVAKQSALFSALDAVIPLLGRGGLSVSEQASARELRDLYGTLVEPGLLPYYRALEPDFFDWLDRVAG
jgi:hypothetical protein